MKQEIKFQTTSWIAVSKIKSGDQRWYERIVKKYTEPITKFIIYNNFSPQDAEDLSQEVFIKIFKDKVFSDADRSKGKLRNLILAVTKNVIKETRRKQGALKRRQGDKSISLDQEQDEDVSLKNILAQEDPEFSQIWARHILNAALGRLHEESKRENQPYFEVFNTYINSDSDYKDLAVRFSKDIQDIKNYIHRAKQKIKKYIQEEIAEYSVSFEDFYYELKYLEQYMSL